MLRSPPAYLSDSRERLFVRCPWRGTRHTLLGSCIFVGSRTHALDMTTSIILPFAKLQWCLGAPYSGGIQWKPQICSIYCWPHSSYLCLSFALCCVASRVRGTWVVLLSVIAFVCLSLSLFSCCCCFESCLFFKIQKQNGIVENNVKGMRPWLPAVATMAGRKGQRAGRLK